MLPISFYPFPVTKGVFYLHRFKFIWLLYFPATKTTLISFAKDQAQPKSYIVAPILLESFAVYDTLDTSLSCFLPLHS